MRSEKHDLRSSLFALGATRLANALCALAARNADVAAHIEMILSTSDAGLSRIQERLEEIKLDADYYSYEEANELAYKLESLLEDIQSHVATPHEGVAIMAAFFETDAYVLEKCDDSDGAVACVYEYSASDAFIYYACGCADKQRVAEWVFELYLDSSYGVRHHLLKRAGEFLPREQLQWMVGVFQEHANNSEANEYARTHALMGIEILAKQLKDPVLFARARQEASPELSSSSCLEIARLCHECGKNDEALTWIGHVTEDEWWQEDEMDELLYSIHQKQGNRQQAEAAARRLFHREHTKERFEWIVAVVGKKHRAHLLEEQTAAILERNSFHSGDVVFLTEMKDTEAAAAYLIRWADHLDGDDYYVLAPVADDMRAGKQYLAATVAYRALLNSMLERGQGKTYRYGAKYLHALDAMAPSIQDWQEIVPHDVYKQNIAAAHKRKWRFWDIYGKRP